jgi:hypothetical protein
LSRLVHAVTLGLVVEGWALDENTTLCLEEGAGRLAGLGNAYHVTRQGEGSASIRVLAAPTGAVRLQAPLPDRPKV